MNKYEPGIPALSPAKAKPINERSAMMSTPKCDKCGGRTYLSRREPHPQLGQLHELHTYRCASCEHCQERDADLRAGQ